MPYYSRRFYIFSFYCFCQSSVSTIRHRFTTEDWPVFESTSAIRMLISWVWNPFVSQCLIKLGPALTGPRLIERLHSATWL
jgi:hypothetical protein